MQSRHHSIKPDAARIIHVFLPRHIKSNRDRFSGIMRRCAHEQDIRVICWQKHSPDRNERFTGDAAIFSSRLAQKFRPALRSMTKIVTLDQNPNTTTPHPNVSIDDKSIVRAGTDLLIRRGHTHFAFIGSDLPPEQARSRSRARFFKEYLWEKGFDCHIYRAPEYAISGRADELDALVRFLEPLSLPCGIMVYADNRAQTVMDACRFLHLSIPDQIAIVGVDNETEICENLRPTLSSILPDFESSGYLAADLAIRLMNGESVEKAVHTFGVKTVVERESTQDLTCGGRLISRVDEYIRSNYTQKLNVGKVAEALNVSRRLLELRFRAILGCSVLERITAIRIADAKSKLERTNLPVGEIAIGCGYGTERAFRTAFTSATGLTPLAYRHKTLR